MVIYTKKSIPTQWNGEKAMCVWGEKQYFSSVVMSEKAAASLDSYHGFHGEGGAHIALMGLLKCAGKNPKKN